MLIVFFYQFFAGFLAWYNYILIKNNRRIYHALNGAVHIAAALLIGIFTKWNYGVSCLLFTRVVFDTVLNLLREKGLGYISPDPSAWTDRVEEDIILWLAGKKASERRVEWTAILFRIFILGLATIFLFV